MRGNASSLGDDLVRRAPNRRAAHIGRARTAVPAARRDQIGVALTELNAVVWQAEAISQNLRKRRLMTLPYRLRAGDERHCSVRLKADVDVLVRRPGGPLDVIGDTYTAQLSSCLTLLSPGGESIYVGPSQRMVQGFAE